MTPNLQVARQMALYWGAHSVQSQDVKSYEQMVSLATSMACNEGFAVTGNQVVVVAGIPFGQSGSTNNLKIARVGE